MYTFKIKSPYYIYTNPNFIFGFDHNSVRGEASYDAETGIFTVRPFEEMREYTKNLFDEGFRFSTGGMFDNVGNFRLSEVSLVRTPRFETEMIHHEL